MDENTIIAWLNDLLPEYEFTSVEETDTGWTVSYDDTSFSITYKQMIDHLSDCPIHGAKIDIDYEIVFYTKDRL